MGKRKSKRKPQSKKKEVLDTQFNCLFCNHEKSIECKLDQTNKVGHLFCKVCGVTHQCPIMSLSEAIDVYSDWIDACDNVNKDKSRQRDGGGGGGSRERPADGEEDDYDERERGGGRRRYAGSEEEED